MIEIMSAQPLGVIRHTKNRPDERTAEANKATTRMVISRSWTNATAQKASCTNQTTQR